MIVGDLDMDAESLFNHLCNDFCIDTGDDDCDIDVDPTNVNQYIVWANGGLGETAFIHFRRSGSQ